MCMCIFSRDLIKVLKWYVDRIVDAEHQDHIQQVLKVRHLVSGTHSTTKADRVVLSNCTFLYAAVFLDTLSSNTHIHHYTINTDASSNTNKQACYLSQPSLLIYLPISSEYVAPPFIIPLLCLLRSMQF